MFAIQLWQHRVRAPLGLNAHLAARFGPARYDEYNQLYAFFVGLVEAGKLGGARFSGTADRASS